MSSIIHVCILSHFSHVQLFAIPQTEACQASLAMGFSRQEYWIGLPCPPPVIFPTQGSNPRLVHLLHWQEGSLPLVISEKPIYNMHINNSYQTILFQNSFKMSISF